MPIVKAFDSRTSTSRKNSPHRRLIDWIRNPKTKEIFMSYLSFSNSSIAKELCQAIKKRHVKVTLVFDSNNESELARMRTANSLKTCAKRNSKELVQIVTRGNTRGLGYAHNKLFFVNPHHKMKQKLLLALEICLVGLLLIMKTGIL